MHFNLDNIILLKQIPYRITQLSKIIFKILIALTEGQRLFTDKNVNPRCAIIFFLVMMAVGQINTKI